MSDWLSIIIVILIIAIVLDGIRRARNSRRSKVRLSKNARKADKMFESDGRPGQAADFPSGGARKLGGKPLRDSDYGEPEQASLELDEPVPMLMESVEEQSEPVEQMASVEPPLSTSDKEEDHLEPTLGSLTELDEPETNTDSALQDPGYSAENRINKQPEKKSKFQMAADYFTRDQSSEPAEAEPADGLNSIEAEEILVINIMCKQDQYFLGEHILEVLSSLKLKFGQMGIFHRHVDDDGDAASLFSIANIVEPGIFDLSTMSSIETPGLCMFLPLPSAVPAVEAYENLITTARHIATELNGELKDENRSALTNQTIEHGRQRVLEFERKHKLPS